MKVLHSAKASPLATQVGGRSFTLRQGVEKLHKESGGCVFPSLDTSVP